MRKVQFTLLTAKICKIPPKYSFNLCCVPPHLLTLPLPPSLMFTFFRRGNPHPDRGQPPTGEALHIHNWAPLYLSRLSLSFLLTQNTIHPHSPTNSCKWHQVDAKCLKQSSGLVGLVGHDSSSTQLVLPYSSQRSGTDRRTQRRSADTRCAIF